MVDIATLSTGALIGFAVGITVAALLVAWREKNVLKRLRNIVGAGWKIRLESIKLRYFETKVGHRDPFPPQDVSFLLQIVDIIRKD
jgi:hypothetical protein